MAARRAGKKQPSPEVVVTANNPPMPDPHVSRSTLFAISGFLVALVLIVYAQTVTFDFVNYDDTLYVTKCPMTQKGLNAQGILWAWTTFEASNWHPLTWMSHQLDVSLFGVKPGGPHAVNMLWHAANTILLLLLFFRATRQLWPSALLAALFAIHPLHVESVAWIAERKDVLSTCLGLIALHCWLGWTARRSFMAYTGTLVFYALSLSAKPMLVTLPVLMLVMDLWPLNRTGENPFSSPLRWFKLGLEKLPFFALALASAIVTILAQRAGGSVAELDQLPMLARIGNALATSCQYLLSTVLPVGLAPFYPHPGESRPLWQPMLAALFWGGMAWTFWRWRNTRPWWLAGWAWYCVALLPVAGLLQVGAQSHADRYTYVPLIGVFAACIWAGHERLRSAEKPVVFGVCAALGVWVLLLTGMAFAQTAHWRDSQSLYRHALRVTKGNHLAHKNLGVALTEAADIVAARTGRPDVALLKEALTHYVAAVKMRANDPDIHYNIGNTYMSLNDNSQAADAFRRAIKLKPDHLLAHYNLANMLARAGDTETALAEYAEALRIDPNHTDALANMGNTYAMARRFAEAEQCYRKALAIDPANCDIHINLGNVFWEQGRQQEGLEAYQNSVKADPKKAQAHYSLGLSLRTLNRKPEALEAFKQALALDPKLDSARRAMEELK